VKTLLRHSTEEGERRKKKRKKERKKEKKKRKTEKELALSHSFTTLAFGKNSCFLGCFTMLIHK